MFNCVFVTFTYGILGEVCYLIVSITDLCCLSYFVASLDMILSKQRIIKMLMTLLFAHPKDRVSHVEANISITNTQEKVYIINTVKLLMV